MQLQTTIQARRPAPNVVHSAHFEGRSSAVASHMLFGSPELTSIAIAYDRNAEIYGEGEPAEYVYKVISGAVRSYKVSTTAGARSTLFICLAIFSASNSETNIPGRPKPSPAA